MKKKKGTRILFVTGSNTGVGKTVLAAALTRLLRSQGMRAAALKPVSSGDRSDAERLREASDGVLSLDQVNPWHFRAPVAPVLAAELEHEWVRCKHVVRFIREAAADFEVLVVEGAGGLLSPLGHGFDSRTLIVELDAEPILVIPNRLGAINQARLTLEALPARPAGRALLVLAGQRLKDPAAEQNQQLLKRCLSRVPIVRMPWLANPFPKRITPRLAKFGKELVESRA